MEIFCSSRRKVRFDIDGQGVSYGQSFCLICIFLLRTIVDQEIPLDGASREATFPPKDYEIGSIAVAGRDKYLQSLLPDEFRSRGHGRT